MHAHEQRDDTWNGRRGGRCPLERPRGHLASPFRAAQLPDPLHVYRWPGAAGSGKPALGVSALGIRQEPVDPWN